MNRLPVQSELDPCFARFHIDVVANVGNRKDPFRQSNESTNNGNIRTMVLDALGVEMPNVIRDSLEVPAFDLGPEHAKQLNPVNGRFHASTKRVE